MPYQTTLQINTQGRDTLNITEDIQSFINTSKVNIGLCHIFLPHTSASLILCENTDPDVRNDLEAFVNNWIPDGHPLFQHNLEGPDDMPAHIRTVFTQSNLTIPFKSSQLLLGSWQGIYLWEHRTSPHTRNLIVTLVIGV